MGNEDKREQEDDFLTTDPTAESPEERYEKSVRESLSDLSVSPDERTHFPELRIELDLDKERAKEIFQRVLEERRAEESPTPQSAAPDGEAGAAKDASWLWPSSGASRFPAGRSIPCAHGRD